MEEGKEYEVTIEGVGSKGDGIAKMQGFIIFVPSGKVGDHVKVRVTTVRRNFAIAEIVKAEETAPTVPVEEEPLEEEE